MVAGVPMGVPMPLILYGTAWKGGETAQLVRKAVAAGFRGIDTACQPKHYNEAGVGEGIRALLAEGAGLKREDLFLQTKFTPLHGQDLNQPLPYDPNKTVSEMVRQSMDVSKRNLGVEYVDSLVLHSPLPSLHDTLLFWKAMEELKHEGSALQLGVSNCYDLHTFKALLDRTEVKPAVLQNRFYAQSGYDRELRALCAQHGVTYQSFWSLTANPHVVKSAVLEGIAERVAARVQKTGEDAAPWHRGGITPEMVFFRFLRQRGIVPLSGTTNELHMAQDLACVAEDACALSPDEMKSIEELLLPQA